MIPTSSHWRNDPIRLAVRLLLSVMIVGAATNGIVRADDAARGVEFFEKKIRPLLVKHCYECHGPSEASAKLRLDSRAGWEKGGQGGPAIVPGDPSASLLMRAVSHRDPQLKMPPKEAGGKLSDAQIEDLTTWIRQGAHDPPHAQEHVVDAQEIGRNESRIDSS